MPWVLTTAGLVVLGFSAPFVNTGRVYMGQVTKVYDRKSYDAENATALNWWSAKLTRMLDRDKAAAVLPFGRG